MLEHHEHDPEFLRLLMYIALENHALGQDFWDKNVRVLYEFLGGYVRRRDAAGHWSDRETVAAGDPIEAIRSAPPATLADNRAFFGLSGEAPVTYDELFQSASALFQKLKRAPPAPPAEDTRDLGALKYVSEARGP